MSVRDTVVSEFPDNTSGEITPSDLRDYVDSAILWSDITGYSGYSGFSNYDGYSGFGEGYTGPILPISVPLVVGTGNDDDSPQNITVIGFSPENTSSLILNDAFDGSGGLTSGLGITFQIAGTSEFGILYQRATDYSPPTGDNHLQFQDLLNGYNPIDIDGTAKMMSLSVGVGLADYSSFTSQPGAGCLAFDYNANCPVISDGTYWYPIQLGSAY